MKLIIPKIIKASYPNMVNAYEINKHQNDSHFLTHGLWSKTMLGMQHVHLQLQKILSYVITKKIRRISRINISDEHKIVINSPEVHFSTKDNMQKLAKKLNYI
jgi:hypothetical protein